DMSDKKLNKGSNKKFNKGTEYLFYSSSWNWDAAWGGEWCADIFRANNGFNSRHYLEWIPHDQLEFDDNEQLGEGDDDVDKIKKQLLEDDVDKIKKQFLEVDDVNEIKKHFSEADEIIKKQSSETDEIIKTQNIYSSKLIKAKEIKSKLQILSQKIEPIEIQ
ncbi:2282_t:CDS:2, partial [Racocetra fulgida]